METCKENQFQAKLMTSKDFIELSNYLKTSYQNIMDTLSLITLCRIKIDKMFKNDNNENKDLVLLLDEEISSLVEKMQGALKNEKI